MVNPGDAPSNETCIIDISVMRVVNSQKFCRFSITSKAVVNGDEVEDFPVSCAMHGQTKANRHGCYLKAGERRIERGNSNFANWITNLMPRD
jgi:hypothetical protein